MLRNGIPEDVVAALQSVSRAFRAWGARVDVTRPLRDGEALALRDRTLHVHHRPGHSPTDTVFHDRDRRILIAADHLLGHISSNPLITRPRDGSAERPQALVQYLESLAATREMDVDLVLPGHGDPITDHRALIDERFALHRRRADKIHRLLAERPRSAYEIAQALWGNIAVTQAYLTLSEVLGHLDVLANEGRVQDDAGARSARLEQSFEARSVASRAVSAETALERAEELAERLLPDRTPKRRMLVIVNPYATTVSDRLRNLVVYALQSRYSVEAIDTEKRDHATQICREAAREGYDVVVAFGGDGTVNEAANGLVGSETPLTALPGGSTNVWARTLGIPNDVVDATEHLLRMADEFQPRRVDLGRVDDRHFVFASGVGLDASVVERVDRHPLRKARYGAWYYSYAGVDIFTRRYLVRPPHVRVHAGRSHARGRHGDRPELGPVHLLPPAPDPGGRRRRASTAARSAWPCCAARRRWSCPR